MQPHRILSSLLIGSALLVGTPLAASADAPAVAMQITPSPAPKSAVAADADRYAALEKQSPATAKFEGGGEAIYIGGSVLTVVLILLLIVIIL